MHKTHCLYLELDQHAFTAHTPGAPQVVDVFIFLIQLPCAHCFFTGAIVTYTYKLLTLTQDLFHNNRHHFVHCFLTLLLCIGGNSEVEELTH